MRKTRPIHLGKKGYKKLWPIMSDEERRLRNGDKRVKPGYTSSGIKLPDREEMLKYHEEKMERLKAYREKHKDDERKPRGKFFITQNTFGAR